MSSFGAYWHILLGAYGVIVATATYGPVQWWLPVVWVAVWLTIDAIEAAIKRAWRRHKRFRDERKVA